jgi:hypothetical protein
LRNEATESRDVKREAGNVRQKAEGWGARELGGNGATERREPKADRDRDRGSLSLSEIAVGMSRVPSAETREARVLGEVIASKPAWKRRRASENDDELLQLLADGLGAWLTHHQAPAS